MAPPIPRNGSSSKGGPCWTHHTHSLGVCGVESGLSSQHARHFPWEIAVVSGVITLGELLAIEMAC